VRNNGGDWGPSRVPPSGGGGDWIDVLPRRRKAQEQDDQGRDRQNQGLQQGRVTQQVISDS